MAGLSKTGGSGTFKGAMTSNNIFKEGDGRGEDTQGHKEWARETRL